MLMDNNLTAAPEHFEVVCKQLIKEKVKTDFSQGLDIRLITKDMAKLLSKVKLWKLIHFAWDDIRIEKQVRRGIKVLKENGVEPNNTMFYVIIGHNSTPEEDLYRVETLRGLGVKPYVMPYDQSDSYQKKFRSWVNHKPTFYTVKWEDYKSGVRKKSKQTGARFFIPEAGYNV